MKSVLITGGCGFIGSHLVELFLSKRIKVVVLDKTGKRFSPDWLKDKKNKNLKLIYRDIRFSKIVNDCVKKVDYVIHLAALISIPHSYKKPEEHLTTNILGTFNVLEAVKKYKKKCIITSTSETYGSGKYFPMDEYHSLSAQSPYAATKISADQLALSYYNSYDTKVKIVRPFNCYGPRQSPRAVIPNMILQILDNQKKIYLGNIKTIRDYTFVKDLCSAFWLIYKSDKGYGQVFNVGSNKGYKIEDIFKKLKKVTNFKGKIKQQKKRYRPSKSEVTKLHASNQKIKKLFKWKLEYSFNKGLKESIDWYKNNMSNFKKTKASKYQI